jgi:hypothetical protein
MGNCYSKNTVTRSTTKEYKYKRSDLHIDIPTSDTNAHTIVVKRGRRPVSKNSF